jgi:hypothetical protein
MARTKGAKNKTASTIEAVVPAPIPTDLTDLVTAWWTAKQTFEAAQEEERRLRQAIVTSSFDITKLEGTDTIDIGWGAKLRLSRELAYNATNENSETEALLNVVGKIDPSIATALVRWKPDIAKKEFRKLVLIQDQYPELQAAMLAAVTLKPGMPQLELVPAKVADEPAPVVIESGFPVA